MPLFGCIPFAEQALDRNVHKIRVPEIGLPVRKGQLNRLTHGADVPGRIMPERQEIDPLQDLQDLMSYLERWTAKPPVEEKRGLR